MKKATGFTVTETVTEYVTDEDGNRRIQKEKEQSKYIPPDLSAIKAYMEMEGQDRYQSMSDEELEQEKQRLLSYLSSETKEKTKKSDKITKSEN